MAVTNPGRLTPFCPVAVASPAGSICSSIAARCRKAPVISGMTPAWPWTLAKAPRTSIIARTSALSEKSRPTSASPKRSR